jgi:hypothetical protein
MSAAGNTSEIADSVRLIAAGRGLCAARRYDSSASCGVLAVTRPAYRFV